MERKKILIIDDTPMFREIESVFLARTGRVLVAESGAEGLAVARRERPDVILVDAFMPGGMDGAAVVREVRADSSLAHARVLVLCSSDRAEDRAAALRAGADDVLPKPISRVALIESVGRFLRFARARGLPRARWHGRVRIDDGNTDWWGTARNLSRGGVFVEAGKELAPRSEVTLEFELPDSRVSVRPTAEVVWLDRDTDGSPQGLGLRFLAMDGRTARYLDEWVHERASLPAWDAAR
jgi:twitching motility two-component system response regulator PilH